MNDEFARQIIERIIDNANDTIRESKTEPKSEFLSGKRLAYYEVLDSIKNMLEIEDMNIVDFGLNVNLEKNFLW